jgi:hypothetical protein
MRDIRYGSRGGGYEVCACAVHMIVSKGQSLIKELSAGYDYSSSAQASAFRVKSEG